MQTLTLVSNINGNASARMEAAKKALAKAKADYERNLPVAPADVVRRMAQITASVDVTEDELKAVKASREAYRFREEEKQQLAAAKLERLKAASLPENRQMFADACLVGHVQDARRKLRADGRVVSTIKVLV